MIARLYIAALTPLARLLGGVHPNLVTLASLPLGLLAGASFWMTGHDRRYYFVAGAAVAVSGIADSLDGLMARMHDRRSTLGDFLDHFLDRIVDVAVLGGLSVTAHATTAFGLAVTLVVLLNAYLGTQIEATFHRRFYSGLGKAELFVGLVVGSVVLGFLPEATIPVVEWRVHLVDGFFAVAGLLALQAMAHRLRLAFRLAQEADAPAGRQASE